MSYGDKEYKGKRNENSSSNNSNNNEIESAIIESIRRKDPTPTVYSSKWENPNLVEEKINIAVEKLKEFYEKNGRSPSTKEARQELGLGNTIRAIYTYYLKLNENKIFNYSELLAYAGLPKHERNYLRWNNTKKVKNEIDNATEKLKEFYEKYGRVPTVLEAGRKLGLDRLIAYIIKKNERIINLGIYNYNDLLKKANLPTNKEKLDMSDSEKERLINLVAEKLNKFYEKYQRSPKISEAYNLLPNEFMHAIKEGKLKQKYNISSYNNFLNNIGLPSYKKQKILIWDKPEMVNNEISGAIKKLKEFYKKNGRPPTSREAYYDKELHLNSLIIAIFKHKLDKYGILSYTELLKKAGLPSSKKKFKKF
ncbi:MAG: hypothetical protein M1538_00760 [Candidatus Marsarchaeota archaeon]|jgi:hypothetical protein|nr:hypothetical protein [Candidatus Marsarchaeota archaeon]